MVTALGIYSLNVLLKLTYVRSSRTNEMKHLPIITGLPDVILLLHTLRRVLQRRFKSSLLKTTQINSRVAHCLLTIRSLIILTYLQVAILDFRVAWNAWTLCQMYRSRCYRNCHVSCYQCLYIVNKSFSQLCRCPYLKAE